VLNEKQTILTKRAGSDFPRRLLAKTMLCPWLMLLVATMLLPGCYPDWPEHSGTAQVEGEVFLDGFPINHTNVVFLPAKLRNKAGQLLPLAYGKTDARGKFKMEDRTGSPNILAGQYYVLISLVDVKPTKEGGSADDESQRSTRVLSDVLADAQSAPVSRAELLELIDQDQVVPAIYNRQSSIEYDLTTIDPLLRK